VDAERLVTGSDDGTLRVLRLHDLSFPMRAYAEKGWLTEDPRAGLLWKTPAPEARPEFISPAFETRLTR
jgi:hypothetical protein